VYRWKAVEISRRYDSFFVIQQVTYRELKVPQIDWRIQGQPGHGPFTILGGLLPSRKVAH